MIRAGQYPCQHDIAIDALPPARRQPAVAFHTLRKGTIMLYTIAVVLLILWLLGLVTSYTIGGFIHVLLVIAVIMVLLRLISGRGV
jgi:hypothetical protein